MARTAEHQDKLTGTRKTGRKQARNKHQAHGESPAGRYRQGLDRLLREAALFVGAALTVFLFAALVSYDRGDPGWSGLGSGAPIANLFGAPGAWFADVLLSLFGYLGFIFPLLVFYGGWLIFINRNSPGGDSLSKSIRAASLLLCLIAACGLAWLILGPDKSVLPQGSGGIVGMAAGGTLASAVHWLGAAWLLITLLVIMLSVGLGFSWFTLTERIGDFVLVGARDYAQRAFERFEQWRDEREQRRAAMPEATSRPKPVAPTVDAAASPSRARPATTVNTAKQQRIAPTLDLVPAAGERDEPAADIAAPAVPRDLSSEFDDEPLAETFPEPPRPAPVPIKKPKKNRAVTVADLPSEPAPDVPKYDPAVDSPIPPTSLLDLPREPVHDQDEDMLRQMSEQLEQHLANFNVKARVVAVEPGPVITRFEIDPAPGVKVSQISNLAKDLARAMSTTSVRVVEVIPGKSVVGLEIPNANREIVGLREILESALYSGGKSPLTMALGKDIGGNAVTADLGKMPHLLVAGTTGSGKSVAINAMILSILHKALPEEARLIMIDPKMLELSVYEGIPHLLAPVVTDMKDAANALRWCVGEMERRYKLMAALGVRNMAGFNAKVVKAIEAGTPIEDPILRNAMSDAELEAGEDVPTLEPMPAIVVIVDELADMMMVVGKKVEELIARLAQKARAAGLHMILATQRPSVDVITGLIKANIPTRIAFQVASKIDSRTILDQQGAESLLGHGDMLYLPPGTGFSSRVHGAFVDDHEVHKVVEYLKQTGRPDYIEDILEGGEAGGENGGGATDDDDIEADPLYDQAVAIVLKTRKASISYVQRRLRVGYNRAARLVEQMENAGVVGPLEGSGGRDVLAPPPPADD